MRQYDNLRRELEQRKASIEERIKEADRYGLAVTSSFSTGELSQYDNHPADTATDLYEREKDIAIYEKLEKELEDVDYALNKMQNGSYGVCEVTGQQIPYDRLQANPTARTVVEHSKGLLANHRPVEEAVLGNFDEYNFDNRDDETEFDAEDAYQSVASFNENSMVFEDSSLDRTGELIGYVEELEAFASTDINGYQGDDSVDFQRNIHYDQYLNEK
ncbi:TraR/DksA C4-type zinc finger protein [Alkalihalobacterium sp. APHAB7]|uniref:TraR/DksA C4-type zinc finger protein n=1 Tax=Alkalihalobacterium sp. APHAB7 TaxID=3402081 RepID=UPI003AAF1761